MATYYWTGTGGGTWDTTTTTNWSATSGGAGGVGVPGSADTAIFDNNSGSSTITTTASGPISITALTLNTGFTGTVAFGNSFTASGLVWLVQGTLNTNSQTCNWFEFSSANSNVRTLTLGASAITISGTNAAIWNCGSTSNLTVTANTAVVTMTGVGSNFRGNGLNWNGLSLVYTGGGPSSGGDTFGTFLNVTYTGTSSNCYFYLGANLTVTGTLTINGLPASRVYVNNINTPGTAIIITAAVISMSYVDFADITGAGAASWNLSAITGLSGDCGGNSGITFTTAATQYWVGGTGNWTSTTTNWASSSGGTGGSGRVPLPQDNATFDVNSFSVPSQVVTLNSVVARICKNLSFTGVTNTPNFTVSASPFIYGSLTFVSGMTVTGTRAWTFAGRSTYIITNGGQSAWALNCIVAAPNGTYTLADALTCSSSGALNVSVGTFDNSVNNATISAGSFSATGSNTRAYKMGTGTVTLSGSGWTSASPGFTLTPSTCVVSFTTTSTATVTTGGVSMPSVKVNGNGGTVTLQDFYTCAVGLTVSLAQGTLNTNNQTCSWGTFICGGSVARTLTMGSSAIAITGNVSGEGWQGPSSNLTVTANTAVVTFSATNVTIALASQNYNGMSIVITAAFSPTLGGGTGCTLGNFTYAPVTVSTTNTLLLNTSLIVTGTVTFTGAAAPNIPSFNSLSLGTPHTITCNGTVAINSRIDFSDLVGAGTATWNLPTGGDLGGNSGITFASPQTNYYYATANATWSTAANWYLASGGTGGAGRVPYPQDTAIFNANSGAHTYSFDTVRFGTLTATGTTSTLSINGTGVVCYGNIAMGGTNTGSSGLTLAGRSAQTITSNGVQWLQNVAIGAFGGSYTLQDNFVCTQNLNITNGTFTATAQNVTCNAFFSTSANGTVNMGSGTWTATVSGSHAAFAGPVTLNAGTSTLVIGALAGPLQLQGNGKTFNTVQLTNGSPVVISGSNTFANLIAGPTTQLTFTSGSTQTISSANGWQVTGTDFGYVSLPGVSGQYISTPDSAAIDVTGDIDLRCQVALTNWANGTTNQMLLGKKLSTTGTIADQAQFLFYIGTTGLLMLQLSSNGSVGYSIGSSVTTGFAANTLSWVRTTWQASTGHVTFYTSSNGTTWTQLGTVQGLSLSSVPSIFNGTAPLEIGSDQIGTINFAVGKFYRAQIYNGIGGTLVFDANFATKPVGANTFTESSSTAATVTISGTTAQASDGRVLVAASTPGSAATVSVASGTVQSNYLSLQDSTATGGATFYAGNNSTNISNNMGWTFGSLSTPSSFLSLMGIG